MKCSGVPNKIYRRPTMLKHLAKHPTKLTRLERIYPRLLNVILLEYITFSPTPKQKEICYVTSPKTLEVTFCN